MIRNLLLLAASIACALQYSTASLAADSAAGNYTESLRSIYGSYQGVLARRDACTTAYPQARGTHEKAFSVWHGRNKKVIGELDQRFSMMIHGASKDEKDYARNIGKYEGALLRQREEVKQTLLQQDKAQLDALCHSLIEFLQSADSDLEKEFAEDLAVVRKRPLASR